MKTFIFSLFLRLFFLIILIIPFVGENNTLTVYWFNQSLSINLAVSVFFLLICFMLVHTIIMQFYDLGASWKAFKNRSLGRRLSRTKEDVRLLLTHSASCHNIDAETERLADSLSSKNFKLWGEFLTTLSKVESYSTFDPDSKILKRLYGDFYKLDSNKAFTDKVSRARILWRVANLLKDNSVLSRAHEEMQRHDPRNPLFSNYLALKCIDNNDWQGAVDKLIEHKNTKSQIIASAWLKVTEKIVETELEPCDPNKTDPLLIKDCYSYLDYAVNCYKKIHKTNQYLLVKIKLMCIDNNVDKAKRLLILNASNLKNSIKTSILWLQCNKIDVKQLDISNSKETLALCKEWIKISQSSVYAKITYIELCFLFGYPQIGEPVLEDLLQNPQGITLEIRNKLVEVLACSGKKYLNQYLSRLNFKSQFGY